MGILESLRAVSLALVSRSSFGLWSGAAQPLAARNTYTTERYADKFSSTITKFTNEIANKQYGDASNSSRPGGVLATVPFTSNSGNTTLRLVADNSTMTSLASIIGANCSSLISGNQSVVAFDSGSNSSNSSSSPLPEQAIQYYRASSIVLTLDGYNDTDALQANSSTNVPIPSWVNQTMLQCVNQTIGAAAPLIDSSAASSIPVSFDFGLRVGNGGLVCLAWMIGYLLRNNL